VPDLRAGRAIEGVDLRPGIGHEERDLRERRGAVVAVRHRPGPADLPRGGADRVYRAARAGPACVDDAVGGDRRRGERILARQLPRPDRAPVARGEGLEDTVEVDDEYAATLKRGVRPVVRAWYGTRPGDGAGRAIERVERRAVLAHVADGDEDLPGGDHRIGDAR